MVMLTRRIEAWPHMALESPWVGGASWVSQLPEQRWWLGRKACSRLNYYGSCSS
jgi:hypothetical protein